MRPPLHTRPTGDTTKFHTYVPCVTWAGIRSMSHVGHDKIPHKCPAGGGDRDQPHALRGTLQDSTHTSYVRQGRLTEMACQALF